MTVNFNPSMPLEMIDASSSASAVRRLSELMMTPPDLTPLPVPGQPVTPVVPAELDHVTPVAACRLAYFSELQRQLLDKMAATTMHRGGGPAGPQPTGSLTQTMRADCVSVLEALARRQLAVRTAVDDPGVI